MENKKTINDITMYKGDCLSVMDRLIEQDDNSFDIGVDRIENV